MAFRFENLQVWQRAVKYTAEVASVVKTFPAEERYVLSSQFMRAADSIALNIAEGSTGQSTAEFKRFLGYAIRSAVEVVTCLHLARARSLINEDTFVSLYNEVEEIVKMTQALRNSLDKK